MVGGVAIVGYLLYKKYGNKGSMTTKKGSGTSSFDGGYNFMNASGVGRTRAGGTPLCPECGKNGVCLEQIPRTEATIQAGIAGQMAEKQCGTSSGTASTTLSRRRM